MSDGLGIIYRWCVYITTSLETLDCLYLDITVEDTVQFYKLFKYSKILRLHNICQLTLMQPHLKANICLSSHFGTACGAGCLSSWCSDGLVGIVSVVLWVNGSTVQTKLCWNRIIIYMRYLKCVSSFDVHLGTCSEGTGSVIRQLDRRTLERKALQLLCCIKLQSKTWRGNLCRCLFLFTLRESKLSGNWSDLIRAFFRTRPAV